MRCGTSGGDPVGDLQWGGPVGATATARNRTLRVKAAVRSSLAVCPLLARLPQTL